MKITNTYTTKENAKKLKRQTINFEVLTFEEKKLVASEFIEKILIDKQGYFFM